MSNKVLVNEACTAEWTNDTGAAVNAGDNVLIGTRLAHVLGASYFRGSASGAAPIANGEKATVLIAEAVISCAKDTGAGTAGALFGVAYWNATTKKITGVASGNTAVGIFWKACATGDATCEVRLPG